MFRLASVALSVLWFGCGPSASHLPQARPSSPLPATSQPAPADPLAMVKATNLDLPAHAYQLAAQGDDIRLQVSQRLAHLIRSIGTAPWRQQRKPRLTAAGVESETMTQATIVYEAMGLVGGAPVIEASFAEARTESQPIWRRYKALRVLQTHVTEPQQRRQIDEIAAQLDALVAAEPRVGLGQVANASTVVAGMRRRFRHCYQTGVSADPNVAGSITLQAKVGRYGNVEAVTATEQQGNLTTIVPCLENAITTGAFAPPAGGRAMIIIPITFVLETAPPSS